MTPSDEERLPSIHQVLALRDPERSELLGPALWAALTEIEQFCNQVRPRAEFSRSYVSEFIPDRLRSPSASFVRRWYEAIFGSGGEEDEEARVVTIQEGDQTLASARGRYHRTYDGEKLARVVMAKQAEDGIEADFTLLITDRELAEPALRYVLWWFDETRHSAAVVSTVAMDPAYWRMEDSNRVATVKRRVRGACLWNVLQFLGAETCDNESCYLFEDVTAFSDLDWMSYLGEEHEEEQELIGLGFEANSRRPYDVQPVLTGLADTEGNDDA